MRPWLVAVAIGGAAMAQAPSAPPGPPLRVRTSYISGQVVSDASGLGLRRARVVIHPLEAGTPAIGVEADEEGKFEIREIPRGAHALEASRDGYLSTGVFRQGGLRMPQQFSLSGGEEITDIVFRLKPWSVMAGRVHYEDGDPAVGVKVTLYREFYVRGRHGFREVAGATTNDLGEYRVHGLTPGAYFVAVVFEGDRTGPQVEDQPRVDASGREVPVPTYTTTYYPNTIRLSEALPVRIEAGREIDGIDLYMRPVERRKLAGRITDGVSGEPLSAASVILERLDSGNAGTLPAPTKLTFDNNDRFTIDDVAPGNYRMWITGQVDSQPVAGEQSVLVTNADIEDLEIPLLPARDWKGRFAMYDASPLPRLEPPPRVTIEPRSERGATVGASGWRDFDASLWANETYDVFVRNLPENYYLSQVRVGGSDVRSSGLKGSMAGSQPFELVLDPRGGQVEGVVFGPEGDLWSGAQVALIPDPPRDRLQSYREVYADQYGIFRIFGVPPGRYLLTAWLDEAPCEIYEPSELERCRATGMRVDVAQGSQQSLGVNIKAVPGR